ncbi:hypothetical protein BG003_003031 [Podila horticola]|nr:hypothetical protein BG003_003031 [Podila horticola]
MSLPFEFARPPPDQIPTQTCYEASSKPRVLIAGDGIGGLTLAILLKKAGIPFEVFERNYDIKQLDSVMALGAPIAPLLQQLGIYDDLVKIAKPLAEVNVITDDMEPMYTMNLDRLKDATDFYDLLWKQVPEENIVLGKSLHNFDQDKKSVLVRCTDASKYYCDILVGADGAYSRVRETLYRSLEDDNVLSASDIAPLSYGSICLVGQTNVLDPEDFPDLKEELCKDYSVLGTNSKYTAAKAMCNQVRDFKVPGGKDGKVHTLGDLIDRTPKDRISKIMLEEKMFSTWHGGRVALLGDGIGHGATSAMHDAVALANWIVSLESPSMVDVNNVFKEYQAERYPIAKEEFEQSQVFTNVLGKGIRSAITRSVLRWLPESVWDGLITKMVLVRPQVSFLPLIEENGTVELAPQPSLTKMLPIIKERALAKERAAKRTSVIAA